MSNDDVAVEADLPPDLSAVHYARALIREAAHGAPAAVVDDCCLVASELVTNAKLHAPGQVRLRLRRLRGGFRVEVVDSVPGRVPVASGSGLAGLLALDWDDPTWEEVLDTETTTGRGLLLVAQAADDWGVEVGEATKTVWADVATGAPFPATVAAPVPAPGVPAGNVAFHAVPARLVLASAANLDDLLRELQVLEPAGDALTSLASRLFAMSSGVREPLRVAAQQTVEAGHRLVNASVAADEATASTLRELSLVVDQLTEYCRDGRLLTLPPTEEIIEFRGWYVAEIDRQVHDLPARGCPFPAVAPDDPAVLAAAANAMAVEGYRRIDDALCDINLPALTRGGPDDVGPQVASFVTDCFGASSTSLCIADRNGNVRIGWATHYPDDVLSGWAVFSLYDDLPASEVIRTSLPAFFGTVEQRDARFPVFATTPVVGDEALAVLPLGPLAALVLGFPERWAFDAADRALFLRLAERAATALDIPDD